VLVENNTNNIAWQSFDYITDTMLPGMRSGWIGGRYNLMRSWNSSNDPASSNYKIKMVLTGWPEFFILDGLRRVYRTGPWNGIQFSGEPQMKTNSEFTFEYFTNQNDTYYTFNTSGTSFVSRLVLNQSYLQRYVSTGSGWSLYWSLPRDLCDMYAQCGPNGLCNLDSSDSPACTCLTGFEPKFETKWNLHDTTAGCIRRVGLNCTSDGFITINDVKLPDSTNVTVYSTIGLSACRKMCLMNCSCTAYSNSNVSDGGSGCALWTGDLVDIRQFSGGGWTIYYRVAGSEVPGKHPSSSRTFFLLLIVLFFCFLFKTKM
jgi:S-locus glycoprotein domain/PAN-like domain